MLLPLHPLPLWCLPTEPAPRSFILSRKHTAVHAGTAVGSSRGIGLLGPIVSCAQYCWRWNQDPWRPGASLPQRHARAHTHTHTHTHTHSLILGSSWPHGDYLPCLFFFCSSSSPGTPGIPRNVLCEFPYHTSSSWSGGIIYREESRRGLGRQRSQV